MAHAEKGLHRHWVWVLENAIGHTAAILGGFILIVVGLALGVTMIMLPVGLVIGLIGFALFVGGLFAHFDEARR